MGGQVPNSTGIKERERGTGFKVLEYKDDGSGNVVSTEDSEGNETFLDYDVINRQKRITIYD